MPFALIPFLFLVIPLIEIAVFVVVGQKIGVLATVGLVLVTTVAGAILLRLQGFGIVTRMRRTLDEGRLPGRELVHGVMVLAAGILLLTPGFVTDALGLLLFVPVVRDAVWAFVKNRIVIISGTEARGGYHYEHRRTRTIDLDTQDYTANSSPSPWRPKDDS